LTLAVSKARAPHTALPSVYTADWGNSRGDKLATVVAN